MDINPDFGLAKSALRGRLIESRRDSIKYAEVIPELGIRMNCDTFFFLRGILG